MTNQPVVGEIVLIKRQPVTLNLNRAERILYPAIVTCVYEGGIVDVLEVRYASRQNVNFVKGVLPGDGLEQYQRMPNPLADRIAALEAKIEGKASTDDSSMTIADAIRSLDTDNPENWTGAGKPQVSAIEAALGRDITAAERDAAWNEVQASA